MLTIAWKCFYFTLFHWGTLEGWVSCPWRRVSRDPGGRAAPRWEFPSATRQVLEDHGRGRAGRSGLVGGPRAEPGFLVVVSASALELTRPPCVPVSAAVRAPSGPCTRPLTCLASCPFCPSAAAVFQRQRVRVWNHCQRGRLLQRPRREAQPGRGQQKPVQLGQRGLRVCSHLE